MVTAQHWPVWAWAYTAWDRLPPHKGKRLVLTSLHRIGLRSGRPFMWRMANGTRLALRPEEGLVVRETVGWTCFAKRRWEPHVEAEIRRWLRPGDTAIDVGANLGYFTAVMAQAVGPNGQVVSFEPVPQLATDLRLAVAANRWAQVACRQAAVSDRAGTARMRFDPRLSANAAIDESGDVDVAVVTLDDLYRQGELGTPRLVKIDVEGHDLAVLRGARRLLTEARPIVVFEIDPEASAQAGWGLEDARAVFDGIGGYRISGIHHDRGGLPVVDFLAEPTPASG